MKAKWFSFDSEMGDVDLWETEDEAKAAAEKALEYYRGNAAGDGWPECEQCVGYGRIEALTGRVNIQTKAQWEAARTPEDLADDPWPYPDFDEVYDLALLPVEEVTRGTRS